MHSLIWILFACLGVAHGQTKTPAEDEWSSVLENSVPAVVAIKVTATRYFDTERAKSSQGTGFVVDRERGIILTNRHMVHAGPVVAEAVFLNHEEVDLEAIYRDPVHDFGFYRFDPKAVQYMDVVDLELQPGAAKVGDSIRVIGNDSGEKLSILDGTLARLDRNAPNYGRSSYNDFNTFYIQAASNTSGGSSGSPVIGRSGSVVALNAGGKRTTASSFYLPLERAKRALNLIQRGESVPRGTIQTTFEYVPYDELERLGLRGDVEAEVRRRRPEGTGMLVVERVGVQGPGDGSIQPGDILVNVAGKPVDDFVSLEAILDEAVGQSVDMLVERGGRAVSSTVLVQDLHSISPDAFLEVGRAVFNDLSYHLARNYHIPVKGVYLATSGYMMLNGSVPPGTVITHVDGVEVPDLAVLKTELQKKSHGDRLRFRFYSIKDFRHSYESVVVMDRQWFSLRYCERRVGLWDCEDSPAPPEATEVVPGGSLVAPAKGKLEKALGTAMVMVEFDVPYPTAGVQDLNYRGVGTIVDPEKGLVLVDRDTVPVGMGDIEITFADAVRVPGSLAYLHPTHNLAVVSYDPSLLGDLPVSAIRLSDQVAQEGDKFQVVGLNRDGGFVEEKVVVEKVGAIKMLPASAPRFRDSNLDVLKIDTDHSVLGGLVVDKKGAAVAMWASFFDPGKDSRHYYGLPTSAIRPVVDALVAGKTVDYHVLGAEFTGLSFAEARDRGVSDARLLALQERDRNYRKVLQVFRRLGGSPAATLLKDADILIAVDGDPVNRMAQLDALWDRESVELTIVRDGEELNIELESTVVSGKGIERIGLWAGMIVHEPHYEIAAQRGMNPEGVYVAWMWYGSPASRYGLRATRRILAINDEPIPDLDTFFAVVGSIDGSESVRVLMEGLDGSQRIDTLRLDQHYWPTEVVQREGDGWSRKPLSGSL